MSKAKVFRHRGVCEVRFEADDKRTLRMVLSTRRDQKWLTRQQALALARWIVETFCDVGTCP
jgi:hypothetical protein